MRLFLAIDLPESVKKSLSEQIIDLRKEYPEFNWVEENNYHLTIFFFGETESVDAIKQAVTNLLYDKESFYLYSTYVDLFMHNKITIYLNFKRERKLDILAEEINNKFSNIYNQRRKFVAHLTLGRCRIPSKQQYFVLKKRLKKININIEFSINKLALFQSIMDSKKPVYKKLEEFNLIS